MLIKINEITNKYRSSHDNVKYQCKIHHLPLKIPKGKKVNEQKCDDDRADNQNRNRNQAKFQMYQNLFLH